MNSNLVIGLDLIGNVRVWGSHKDGLLGLGYSITSVDSPTRLTNLTKVIEISLSENHAVAINSENQAYSWGTGKFGELGLECSIYSPSPSKIQTGLYRKVYCNDFCTLFLNTENKFSYFGVLVTPGSSSLKNLLIDITNSDPNMLFPEKIVYELETENFVDFCAGNGIISLLSDKGLVYILDQADNITSVFSNFFVCSITICKDKIFGLCKETKENKLNVLEANSKFLGLNNFNNFNNYNNYNNLNNFKNKNSHSRSHSGSNLLNENTQFPNIGQNESCSNINKLKSDCFEYSNSENSDYLIEDDSVGNFYICMWMKENNSDEWSTTLFKIITDENFNFSNFTFLDSKSSDLLVLLTKDEIPSKEIFENNYNLNQNRKTSILARHSRSYSAVIIPETTKVNLDGAENDNLDKSIMSNRLHANKQTQQGKQILQFMAKFDDSYNVKFKRTKNFNCGVINNTNTFKRKKKFPLENELNNVSHISNNHSKSIKSDKYSKSNVNISDNQNLIGNITNIQQHIISPMHFDSEEKKEELFVTTLNKKKTTHFIYSEENQKVTNNFPSDKNINFSTGNNFYVNKNNSDSTLNINNSLNADSQNNSNNNSLVSGLNFKLNNLMKSPVVNNSPKNEVYFIDSGKQKVERQLQLESNKNNLNILNIISPEASPDNLINSSPLSYKRKKKPNSFSDPALLNQIKDNLKSLTAERNETKSNINVFENNLSENKFFVNKNINYDTPFESQNIFNKSFNNRTSSNSSTKILLNNLDTEFYPQDRNVSDFLSSENKRILFNPRGNGNNNFKTLQYFSKILVRHLNVFIKRLKNGYLNEHFFNNLIFFSKLKKFSSIFNSLHNISTQNNIIKYFFRWKLENKSSKAFTCLQKILNKNIVKNFHLFKNKLKIYALKKKYFEEFVINLDKICIRKLKSEFIRNLCALSNFQKNKDKIKLSFISIFSIFSFILRKEGMKQFKLFTIYKKIMSKNINYFNSIIKSIVISRKANFFNFVKIKNRRESLIKKLFVQKNKRIKNSLSKAFYQMRQNSIKDKENIYKNLKLKKIVKIYFYKQNLYFIKSFLNWKNKCNFNKFKYNNADENKYETKDLRTKFKFKSMFDKKEKKIDKKKSQLFYNKLKSFVQSNLHRTKFIFLHKVYSNHINGKLSCFCNSIIRGWIKLCFNLFINNLKYFKKKKVHYSIPKEKNPELHTFPVMGFDRGAKLTKNIISVDSFNFDGDFFGSIPIKKSGTGSPTPPTRNKFRSYTDKPEKENNFIELNNFSNYKKQELKEKSNKWQDENYDECDIAQNSKSFKTDNQFELKPINMQIATSFSTLITPKFRQSAEKSDRKSRKDLSNEKTKMEELEINDTVIKSKLFVSKIEPTYKHNCNNLKQNKNHLRLNTGNNSIDKTKSSYGKYFSARNELKNNSNNFYSLSEFSSKNPNFPTPITERIKNYPDIYQNSKKYTKLQKNKNLPLSRYISKKSNDVYSLLRKKDEKVIFEGLNLLTDTYKNLYFKNKAITFFHNLIERIIYKKHVEHTYGFKLLNRFVRRRSIYYKLRFMHRCNFIYLIFSKKLEASTRYMINLRFLFSFSYLVN